MFVSRVEGKSKRGKIVLMVALLLPFSTFSFKSNFMTRPEIIQLSQWENVSLNKVHQI
jgi:hypothetical protein